MRVATVIFGMFLFFFLIEDAFACAARPNVVDLDTTNLSTTYIDWLYTQGYFSSPYDGCNCLYNPEIAWDE